MTSSDERKNLTGLARSIDALFEGRKSEGAHSAEPSDAAEAAAPAVLEEPVDAAEEAAPAVLEEPVDAAEAAAPAVLEEPIDAAEAAAPAVLEEPVDAAEAEAPGAFTVAPEEIVWEPTPPQEGPGRQPAPDVNAFQVAVDTFLQSDHLARNGQAREIREMAAALREAGALDALADAVERLSSREGDPAHEACLAMARSLVTPGVASRLVARLGAARDEQRRAELIQVCQRIGHDMALAVTDALSDSTDRYARRTFMDAMVALGQEGMTVVELMMVDPRWFVVRNAVAILGEVGGDRAVELITTSLAHSDARVRREALLSLARVGGEDAGMLVYGMIEDSDPEVRLAAAMAAGELKVERALKPLLTLLEGENDEDVVIGVLRALGQLGDPGAVNAIEKRAVGSFFSRPSAEVRIAAYRALHSIGTPHAKSLLEEAMEDKHPGVRSAVRQIVSPRS